MPNENSPQNDFEIDILFDKESQSPSNALRTLSNIIEAFDLFDVDLVQSVDSSIKPVLLLKDLEAGSIKAKLKQGLESISDEGIKNLDWKRIVGEYLVKAKYSLIKWLDGKTEITNRSELQDFEKDLYQLAKETKINQFPIYTPISSAKLITNIERVSTTIQAMGSNGKAVLKLENEQVTFNSELDISPEAIEDLLTKEQLESKSEMLLKVKKPDYLGDSKWELRHERKPIDVKVLDNDWLKRFQNREIDVRPGDSLRAEVRTIVKYDYNNEVLAIRYEILEVKDIIKPESQTQIDLFEDSES